MAKAAAIAIQLMICKVCPEVNRPITARQQAKIMIASVTATGLASPLLFRVAGDRERKGTY